VKPTLSQVFSDSLLAAMPQLNEKPRLGVPSKHPALYLGHEACNSTAAIGFRAALHLNAVRSRYTGKERDSESGNDYFGARYYASSMGRFMSPDWSAKAEPVPYAKLDNPQSLNLYAYVGNNPLTRVDVDGHIGLGTGGFEDCSVRGDCKGGGQTAAQQVYNRITRDVANGATVTIKTQQQSGLPKPLIGPSQTGIPSALRSGGATETFTTISPLTMLDRVTQKAGNIYKYQTVDAKGFGVLSNQAVQEYFANTANTNPNVQKGTAGTFDAKGGNFEDPVLCRLPCGANNEYLQNFRSMILQGSDDAVHELSTQNLIQFSSGASVPATATNVIP
jgi:RHS repeat-associated protein